MEARQNTGVVVAAIIGVAVVVGLMFFALGVTAVKPDAGYQAVLIHKPMIFGHGGVDPIPVKTGRKYVIWTTDAIYVNMQPTQHPMHFEDFMSSDGTPLDFDAVIRLRVVNSVVLVENFGPKWYENNVQAVFTNLSRQAVRKHGMNETAIDTTANDAIDYEVSEATRKYLVEAKLPVELVDVTLGKANPPDSIKNQRIETATQEQRIKTESQRKLAEDSRKNAEVSRAAADNAYRNAMQLSQEQFLRLENIKMQREVCSGENKGNCTFVISSGSVAPIISTK